MERTVAHGLQLPGSVAVRRIRSNVATFGFANAVHDIAVRAANRVVLLKVFRGVTIARVEPAFLDCPEPYRPMFLERERLWEFSRDPANELQPDFLGEALDKGDACYALLRGDALAAYGWYSTRPTRLDVPGLVLHFDSEHIYMYKGFTHPAHRGRRLHAIGMTRALQHYLLLGYRGIVSYVESNNFGSLRSVFRMGYRQFGTVSVLRAAGVTLTHATAGCRTYGFRIERDTSRSRATAPPGSPHYRPTRPD